MSLLFYGRLFELDPAIRTMFHGDIDRQGLKLMQTLGVVVDKLAKFEELTPTLRILGQRHKAYGVKTEHYDLVGQAMIWAVGQTLCVGPASEVLQAWRVLLSEVSALMLEGAAEVPDGASPEAA